MEKGVMGISSWAAVFVEAGSWKPKVVASFGTKSLSPGPTPPVVMTTSA